MMRRSHYHEGFKTNVPQQDVPHPGCPEIQNADYDGKTAQYGYSQAIFDLLKEPVSLGMLGVSGSRGRQR